MDNPLKKSGVEVHVNHLIEAGKLQELADKVELMILSAAGDLKLGGLLSPATILKEAEDHLGEGLEALLEMKAALGLTTNLKKVESDEQNA